MQFGGAGVANPAGGEILVPDGATAINTLIFCEGDPSADCSVMVPSCKVPDSDC